MDATHPPTPTMPAALGRVLSLVRKLIDYGKQLAGTAQLRAAAPDFALFGRRFGTADLAAILARITGGLRRTVALEAALCQRAARGQDLTPSSIRLPTTRALHVARPPAPPAAEAEPQPADHAEDPRLARLPTEEEIAAEVRRRPVGAVIADICRDLGITPGDVDRTFWDEIHHAITVYGGSFSGFVGNMIKRLFDFGPGGAEPFWPEAPPRSPAPATGPP